MGYPSIALYNGRTFTTKKFFMVAEVLGAFPIKNDKVIAPTGWTISLENLLVTSGLGLND